MRRVCIDIPFETFCFSFSLYFYAVRSLNVSKRASYVVDIVRSCLSFRSTHHCRLASFCLCFATKFVAVRRAFVVIFDECQLVVRFATIISGCHCACACAKMLYRRVVVTAAAVAWNVVECRHNRQRKENEEKVMFVHKCCHTLPLSIRDCCCRSLYCFRWRCCRRCHHHHRQNIQTQYTHKITRAWVISSRIAIGKKIAIFFSFSFAFKSVALQLLVRQIL